MIRLSNGHAFQFVAASGALAYDGRGWPWEAPLRWLGLVDPSLFTIVTKTLTREPRQGNLRWSHPWSVVKRLGSDGVVNAVGLTNPGLDWWIERVFPRIPARYRLLVSIEADDPGEMEFLIQRLNDLPILGIELNLSCPNIRTEDPQTTERLLLLCESALAVSRHPLIAKLSVTHDYLAVARALGSLPRPFKALSINGVPWHHLFSDRRSPLERFGGGGVSGKKIQPFVWKMADEMSQAGPIPVIYPSVWDYEDLRTLFGRRAPAVSFGSVFVCHPWRPTLMIRRWLREEDAARASEGEG